MIRRPVVVHPVLDHDDEIWSSARSGVAAVEGLDLRRPRVDGAHESLLVPTTTQSPTRMLRSHRRMVEPETKLVAICQAEPDADRQAPGDERDFWTSSQVCTPASSTATIAPVAKIVLTEA